MGLDVLAIRVFSNLESESKVYTDKEECWVQRSGTTTKEARFVLLPHRNKNDLWEIGVTVPCIGNVIEAVDFAIQVLQQKIQNDCAEYVDFVEATKDKLDTMFQKIKDEAKKQFPND